MKKLLFIMFLVAAGGAAWVSGVVWHPRSVHAASSGEQPAVPVAVAPVKQADFPVYLRGLGTVEALNTMAKGKPPVAAYTSDDTIKLGTGSLLTPNNAIDAATGTIQLKAIFANDNERLWPGQFVHARVLVEALDKVPTVPLAAIEHGPDGLFVYTVQPNETVKVQPVNVSYQDENIAVVSKGLQPGQTVVIGGQSRLTNGARVAVGQARAPPGAGAGGRKES